MIDIEDDGLRVREVGEVPAPAALMNDLPLGARATTVVRNSRYVSRSILRGEDNRLLVVVGPCSIHDPEAALEYASRLRQERRRLATDLEIVMRTYLEKPRTTVGWKGLINDPDMDGSFRIGKGLRVARSLLVEINEMGQPAACEFLDPVVTAYVADLVAWVAIGARTTESQVHREMASGLPCPVGFKNGTDGSLGIAVDAICASSSPHHFLSVSRESGSAVVATEGNADCHLILRGGKQPNYDAESVDAACKTLASRGLPERLMIDASHGNSGKDHERQKPVCLEVARQIASGDHRIMGVMVESNLVAGRQDEPVVFGQSITDGCIGWEETVEVLELLAESVRERRRAMRKVG